MIASRTARLLEGSAEELARLDVLSELAPAAVRLAQRAANSALLAQASPEGRRALVTADAETLHAASLPQELADWRDAHDELERRARGGLPIIPARLPQQEAIRDAEALAEALRPGGAARSLLLRAVAASAAVAPGALAELVSAAVLCAGGLMGGLRLLPFASVDATRRAEALDLWHRGDTEPLFDVTLEACAAAAHEDCRRLRRCLQSWDEEDERLAPLGRAAITARRALSLLHERFALSMPALADALDCSRPAAGDALERLVLAGLAVEITGRGRDRVYAWAPAWLLHEA